MRTLAVALATALLLSMAPVAGAGAGAATPADATTAKKKKCKRGYVLKRVKRKKRIRGKVRTVRVKKCVKRKRAKAKPKPQASCPNPYTGRATGMDGVFQYGDVRVDRTCAAVTRVEIKAVSTNCGAFSGTYVVVFNPSSPDIRVLSGSPAITGNKMHVVYQPDKTSDNQTTMDITFSGNTAKGEFHSIGNCKQDGLFTATAG